MLLDAAPPTRQQLAQQLLRLRQQQRVREIQRLRRVNLNLRKRRAGAPAAYLPGVADDDDVMPSPGSSPGFAPGAFDDDDDLLQTALQPSALDDDDDDEDAPKPGKPKPGVKPGVGASNLLAYLVPAGIIVYLMMR